MVYENVSEKTVQQPMKPEDTGRVGKLLHLKLFTRDILFLKPFMLKALVR